MGSVARISSVQSRIGQLKVQYIEYNEMRTNNSNFSTELKYYEAPLGRYSARYRFETTIQIHLTIITTFHEMDNSYAIKPNRFDFVAANVNQ